MYALHVNPAYCKGCQICVAFCPGQALGPAERINEKGYLLPIERDMTRCTGCKLCEIMCPDFAIAIEESEEGGRR